MTSWQFVALLSALVVLVAAIVVLIISERAHRKRKRQLIELPRMQRRREETAEHVLAEVDLYRSAVKPNLYPGIPDTHVITECPMVDAAVGPTPLRDWLRHFSGVDAWSIVVARFYTRAAADPDIIDYFVGADMEQLQRYLLAAMMIVTGQGVTVGLVRRMQEAHADVRNSHGEPITAATWDGVIGVLAGVLGDLGTPPATLVALATTIAPIRAAIVVEPGVAIR